jgi:F0F1-type ATP synthase assembly protein I
MSDVPQPPAGTSKPEDPSIWAALQLAWELGYMIAIPAVLFGFGGAYLDKQYQTSPIFIALGFVLALGISALTVIRKVRTISPR